MVKPFADAFGPQKKKTTDGKTVSQVDMESLAQDPRFQKIYEDPQLQKDIADKNLPKLMSNPKILELTQQLMNDPQALKKLLAVYNSRDQLKKQDWFFLFSNAEFGEDAVEQVFVNVKTGDGV